MNYLIKKTDVSVNPTISIGTEVFGTENKILATISCLTSEHYETLFNLVKDGTLSILDNSGENPISESIPLSIISKLIQLSIDGRPSKNEKLNKDFFDAQLSLKVADGDASLLGIDLLYHKRKEDGLIYFRRARAKILKDVGQGSITEGQAIQIIDIVGGVKISLLEGDWLAAKTYMEFAVTNSAFTESKRVQYLNDINSYLTTGSL